eukprot:SAG31_NODE_2274_length_6037_cov_18.022061_2_plen_165_part_00
MARHCSAPQRMAASSADVSSNRALPIGFSKFQPPASSRNIGRAHRDTQHPRHCWGRRAPSSPRGSGRLSVRCRTGRVCLFNFSVVQHWTTEKLKMQRWTTEKLKMQSWKSLLGVLTQSDTLRRIGAECQIIIGARTEAAGSFSTTRSMMDGAQRQPRGSAGRLR